MWPFDPPFTKEAAQKVMDALDQTVNADAKPPKRVILNVQCCCTKPATTMTWDPSPPRDGAGARVICPSCECVVRVRTERDPR
jgi:hypothetical protein